MPPTGSSLSEFIDTYHLWSVVLLFSLMDVYHFAGLLIHWGFRLCGDAHEEYYNFKARIVENRRRYKRATNQEVETKALPHHAAAD
jgi:hypothetical protein